MLEHEAGSRSGEDIEDVHDMRVATRRMRSVFHLLGETYKPKVIRPFTKHLKTLADTLGAVRDLDVIIEHLNTYQISLDPAEQEAMQGILNKLAKKRTKARKRLIATLDSKATQRFKQDFSVFLTTPQNIKNRSKRKIVPYQVRHLAPILLHERLSAVRAYDTVIDQIKTRQFHPLRIEFKQLRYAVTFFQEVLGTSATTFIEELKTLQDYLGRLNDIATAQEIFTSFKNLDQEQNDLVQRYLDALTSEAAEHQDKIVDVWEHFLTRGVQRKLSDAILILR